MEVLAFLYRSSTAYFNEEVGAMETPARWHTLPAEAVFHSLNSRPTGLAQSECAGRQAAYGPNELQAPARVSPWAMLAEQFRNLLVLILLAATALSAALGHGVEAVVIAIIVLFAVLLGFVQEYRAERAIEALRELAAPTATVLRDGQEVELPARELVPGDVIVLRAGDRVPADARVVASVNLKLEETALTGELLPVAKQVAPVADGQLPLGDRTNMLYAGTVVTYGRGTALVVATGMQTEFGHIIGLLQAVETGRR